MLLVFSLVEIRKGERRYQALTLGIRHLSGLMRLCLLRARGHALMGGGAGTVRDSPRQL